MTIKVKKSYSDLRKFNDSQKINKMTGKKKRKTKYTNKQKTNKRNTALSQKSMERKM